MVGRVSQIGMALLFSFWLSNVIIGKRNTSINGRFEYIYERNVQKKVGTIMAFPRKETKSKSIVTSITDISTEFGRRQRF